MGLEDKHHVDVLWDEIMSHLDTLKSDGPVPLELCSPEN